MLLRRRPHLDLPLPNAHVEAARRERRRAVDDVAVLERELGVVPRTLDGVADELPLGERAAEVRARFGEREDAVAAFHEQDRYAVGLDARRCGVAQRTVG